MAIVFIGLGSNLGNRMKNLEDALERLEETGEVTVLKSGTVLETEPVDYTEQPDFLNLMIMADTSLSPYALLELLKNIEKAMGRQTVILKGPRNIDMDIILYDDLVMKTDQLQVPHHAMLSRKFVMEGLLELDKKICDPVTGKSILEVLNGCN